jgi:hypothetical protein
MATSPSRIAAHSFAEAVCNRMKEVGTAKSSRSPPAIVNDLDRLVIAS